MSTLGQSYTVGARIRDTAQAGLFCGHRNADRRPVMLKIPHGDRLTAAQVAQLRYEHSILSSLEVPGVVRTLDFVETGDNAALVLEDVGERSLDRLVGPARLALGTFLRMAISMSEVLESVHRHHIIHKDIKPHHFFQRADGGALTLVDFAAATRLSTEDRRATHVHRMEGTLAYMSPEQTGRMNRVLDRRTDLYSLGVTFYELLVGALPFPTTDPLELVHSHIARAPVPPHLVEPATPRVLSDIVMKLLSKNAEDRYQDVAGLKADLTRCLELVEGTGELGSFALGEQDFSEELRIPQKLYGREPELAALLATFDRARQGVAELLLISGYSGVGKSALVGEIGKQIARGGRFIAGKFDQLGRRIPYAPITRACGDLIRSLLTEPPPALAAWRRKIQDAVGPNGQVVVDLVPELALVIGPQPAVQPLGPSESQHRFEMAFQGFMQVFTSAEHPLVFFLDDLQWADSASLRLLHLLLTSPSRGHLLVIGAYRANEIDPFHALTFALSDLRQAGAAVHEIKLEALGRADVGHLLADTLGAGRDAVEPLALLALRKTHGNPFFLGQFLASLHRDGLLTFDAAGRRWVYDLDRIEGATVTDNVVDFMVEKLRRLGPGAQHMLRLGACIGHQFNRRTLALVAEQTSGGVAAELWEALREGLLVPLEAGHAYLHEGAAAADLDPGYRFLHDRVQQAAYALIDEAHKQATHLRIGRLMMAGEGGVKDDRLFDVVNHMNLGAALIDDAGERSVVAGMNLTAGRKAKDAAAYGVASKLFDCCVELLGAEGWARHHDMVRAAHLTKAECELVSGHLDQAFSLLDVVEAHARTALERTDAMALRILILNHTNRLKEAAACGVEAARLLGAVFPQGGADLGPAIGAEFAALAAALGDRSIESLIDLPLMTDPESLALHRIIHRTIPAATQLDPQLMTLLIAKAVNLALRHGSSPETSYFYVCWGLVLAVMGDFEKAYRAGQLGIRLNERLDHHAVDGANRFVFGAFVAPWRTSLDESLELLRKGLKVSLDAGNFFHGSFCAAFHVVYRFLRGDDLEEIAAEIKEGIELQRRTGNVVNLRVTAALGRLVANLRGTATEGAVPGAAGGLLPVEVERELAASGNRYLISCYYLCCAVGRYFAGDVAGAGAHLNRAMPAAPANFIGPEIRFYRALLLAERARTLEPGDARDAALGELAAEEEVFRAWAASAPGTFAHRHALVAAELAGLGRDERQALRLYDRAVTAAQESGSRMHQALANELCAGFTHRRGWTRIAAELYLEHAHAGYQRWGAVPKAREIAPRVVFERGRGRGGDAEARPEALRTEMRAEQLDALTVIKASQAISKEIVLPRLIESLMRIVIEQAGAQRGYLMLVHGDEIWVEGAAGGEPGGFARFRLDAAAALGGDERARPAVPRSIVAYVQRTRERVLLTHAEERSLFAGDPDFRANRPRSLLCLPMIRQGTLVGMLYLENGLTSDAFSPDRLSLLEVLSSQAAISLENAVLYDEIDRRVKDRTRELEASLALIKENQAQLIEAERKAAIAYYESEMAIAQKIQTSILPKRLEVPGMEIAAAMVTAGEVGGDYYDLQTTDDGGFWLGVGDVSGHGLNAGLVMLMIQSGLASLMRRDPSADPARLVCLLNRTIYENVRIRLRRDDFATLSLFRFYADGRFVAAGAHEDIVIWRARTGRCEQIPTEGTWVGIMEHTEADTPNQENLLEEGDVLVLYTDGLTEARNASKQVFGVARLAQTLAELHAAPAATICSRMLDQVKAWEASQEDDQTVVVLRRGGRK